MKNRILAIVFILFSIPLFGQGGIGYGCGGTDPDVNVLDGRSDNCHPNPFRLVFEDEFNGNNLDQKFWKYLTGLPTGDKELEYYQPENVQVSNGLLKIISKKESLGSKTWSFWNGTTMENKTGTFDYSSGYVISKYKFPYAYGKFEARIKIPNSNSCRPAFWLYGDNSNEIDIFEFFEDKTTMSCTVHDDVENNGGQKSCQKEITLQNNASFAEDFHTYSVVWNPWFIEFYLDGIQKWTYSRWKTITTQDIKCPYSSGEYLKRSLYVDKPLEIKFSTKVSNIDNALSNPVQMEVDWIRVYYELPCQDITITNASNIPQLAGMYNFVFGKNVNINCNYNVSQDKPLAIIGTKSIEIRGNINASDGYFYSGIDASSDCGGQSVRPLDLLNDSNNLQLNSITVFPNPIDYDQLLNFTYKLNNSNTCIELNIFDGHGQIIEKANLKNGPNFSYRIIAKLPAGIYYGILKLPDGFRKYFKVQKI